MPKIVSRREFLRLATLTGAGAAIAACAPAAAPTEAPVEPAAPEAETEATEAPVAADAPATETIELKLLNENWGEIYNNLMMVIGDEYMKENPGVKLAWEFDPEWRTKLTTLLAAGTPPDLAFMRPDYLAGVAPKGVLLTLDDYVVGAGKKPSDFVQAQFKSGTFQDKLFAVPGGTDVWSLYYNKDLYEAVGLDPEAPPKSISELEEHSAKLLKTADDGTIDTIPMVYMSWFNPMWMHAYGGVLFDEANNKITANDPTNVKCWEWLSEYYLSFGDVDQLTAFAQRPGFFDAGNPFATNQCAYVMDGFWYYEAIDTHAPDMKYGVGYWPTLNGTDAEKANWQIGGWHYSIPKGVPNPDTGWDVLQYMFVDNSGKMGCDTLNGPGVIAEFQPWISCLQDKMGADNRMSPYLHVFTEQAEAATRQFPIIENQTFYTDELTRTFDLVLRKQMTPQDALDEVTKNVQEDLDKIRAEAG